MCFPTNWLQRFLFFFSLRSAASVVKHISEGGVVVGYRSARFCRQEAKIVFFFTFSVFFPPLFL